MTRTTQEVFDSHREAIEKLDFEKLAGDYAEDALMVTPSDTFHGREALMAGFFQAWMAQFPDTKIKFEKVTVEDDVCLIEWTGEASAASWPAGIGVLIVQDGLIQRQIEWFQMVHKEE
jgi:ketosteroid isomerase-like protein